MENTGGGGTRDSHWRELPLRLELLDQPLERQLLMGVGPEGDLPDAPQEFGKGGITGEIAAQG